MILSKLKLFMLRKNMKRKWILLLIILTAPIMCFSQTTYQITAEQLRTTNLIFVEHNKLQQEVPLLQEQINNLRQIDSIRTSIDSIKTQQLINLEDQVSTLNDDVNHYKQYNKIKNWGLVSSSLLIICLLVL